MKKHKETDRGHLILGTHTYKDKNFQEIKGINSFVIEEAIYKILLKKGLLKAILKRIIKRIGASLIPHHV